ncbi:hypothetical protein [Aurantiacibacter hainanensis]|uniref:hypothetical protein n=1 Tax=Aurantiacibacter hainanensis TaxID=3076114 RepID=UPI0030C7534D
MRKSILAAAFLVAGGSVAFAQDADREGQEAKTTQTTNTENQDAAEAQEDEAMQEIVCRRERVTGSLTRVRRTCLTRAEWAQVEANTRDDMIRSGRNASGGKECVMDQFGGC